MNFRERQDLDRHITGNYGEDQFVNDELDKIEAFRKYMGPSGNGMTDKQLKVLAGWNTFLAGWDAAECYENDLDQAKRDKAADKEGEYEPPPPFTDETPDDFGDNL